MRRPRGAMLPPVPAPRVRRRDLYQVLRTAVLDGVLAPGERLPSSRQAADDYGVSRGLVEEAFAQLTEEGFLERAGDEACRRRAHDAETAVREEAGLSARPHRDEGRRPRPSRRRERPRPGRSTRASRTHGSSPGRSGSGSRRRSPGSSASGRWVSPIPAVSPRCARPSRGTWLSSVPFAATGKHRRLQQWTAGHSPPGHPAARSGRQGLDRGSRVPRGARRVRARRSPSRPIPVDEEGIRVDLGSGTLPVRDWRTSRRRISTPPGLRSVWIGDSRCSTGRAGAMPGSSRTTTTASSATKGSR